jgi:hypothetical protein
VQHGVIFVDYSKNFPLPNANSPTHKQCGNARKLFLVAEFIKNSGQQISAVNRGQCVNIFHFELNRFFAIYYK